MPTLEWIGATLFVCTLTMNTVHTARKADDDNNPILIDVVWSEIDYKLHTIPSIQVITNPLLSQQFSPIHKQVFENLAQLNVDYARYAAWFAYPKLVVAELDPPSGIYQCGHAGDSFSVKLSCRQGGGVISRVDFASYGTPVGACGQMKQGTCHAPSTFDIVQQVCIGQDECSIPATSDLFGDPCSGVAKRLLIQIQCDPPQNNTYWDFSYVDPLFEDFLAATDGHSRVVSFSTEPSWLYHFDTPHVYPDNASKADWFYDQGSVFVDPTMNDLGDYYGRLFAWFMKGGFIDEYGHEHVSNHHYNWDHTEIFNEVEAEHTMTPESYTRAYDAIIEGIRRHTNDTQMKYVGMSLGGHNEFDWYRYFLNHSNHAPGIPLDMISYHFYAWSNARTDPFSYETIFEQLDEFTFEVEQIEEIRKILSPETRTTINELGVILDGDNTLGVPPFPLVYWNAAAALYAYSWAKLSRQNIDVVGQSQLTGYPELPDLQLQPQYPSVSMVNWTTGAGTAKYWTSKLLIDTAEIDSDQAVITRMLDVSGEFVFSQAFVRKNGRRWVLIINKRFANVDVFLPGATGGTIEVVSEASSFGPAIVTELSLSRITLTPFSVAVVHMPREDTEV